MKYFTLIMLLACISCNRRSQVNEMISDRPSMNIGDTTSVVYAKAKQILLAYEWDGIPPQGDKRSEFTIDGKIRIREGMTTAESWTVFFYESYNIQNRKKFETLYRRALDGGMSRREWVLENATLEHEAAEEFLIFAQDTLVPYLEGRGLETTLVDEYMDFFKLPVESWMLNDENSYPWNYWGRYYDTYLRE